MTYRITLLAALLASAPLAADTLPDRQTELPAVAKKANTDYLKPRPLTAIPDTEFGRKVKYGYSLFVDSQQMRGRYVGNEQNCVNCHMQAGMKANAAPLWAAYTAYPAYRKKNDKVNTYGDRIQGCFDYSMNGVPPDNHSPELVALSAYAYWLTMSGLLDKYGLHETPVPELSDAELIIGGKREDFILPAEIAADFPVSERGNLAGRGYPKLPKPAEEPSIARGKQVYQSTCAVCHASDGQGIKGADGTQYFPPLWGKDAFNWGAGMHRINTAAFFIYENMPLGKSVQLTEQQAWDVAAYMNSHERPQDPRYRGDLDANDQRYHKHQGYYGDAIDGHKLGSRAYPTATVDPQPSI
ncbi:c-type cytochrome [Photobacterium sp. MCCC 1A19761]|uniref:c-type cytochrome n=1 Tax=Photobacterium sp. MCCC 1A19761 TaxID=3115000 RepID=UPI00307CCB22